MKHLPGLLVALGFLLASILPLSANDETFKPGFFAFFNGVPNVGSYEAEAEMLKKLGYDGISQVYAREGVEKLARRVEAYEKQGLKVLSIYLGATEKPVDEALLKVLGNRGSMIELTVQKISLEVIASIRQTTQMAAKLNIRVALYPHFGNAVATMPRAMELVEKVNHPNLGIMFNLCHFLKSEKAEDLEKVLEQTGPRLFSVSTCGADPGGENWSELIQPLDKGSFSQERLLKALRKVGFNGPVGLQCYGLKGDRQANLKRSIEAWSEIQRMTGG